MRIVKVLGWPKVITVAGISRLQCLDDQNILCVTVSWSANLWLGGHS